MKSLDVEYELVSTGPGGAEYEVFTPYSSQLYSISDRDCMILRRNREDALEQYVLDDLRKQFPELESIRLIRR